MARSRSSRTSSRSSKICIYVGGGGREGSRGGSPRAVLSAFLVYIRASHQRLSERSVCVAARSLLFIFLV